MVLSCRAHITPMLTCHYNRQLAEIVVPLILHLPAFHIVCDVTVDVGKASLCTLFMQTKCLRLPWCKSAHIVDGIFDKFQCSNCLIALTVSEHKPSAMISTFT